MVKEGSYTFRVAGIAREGEARGVGARGAGMDGREVNSLAGERVVEVDWISIVARCQGTKSLTNLHE